jgi:cytochrome c peroxidase
MRRGCLLLFAVVACLPAGFAAGDNSGTLARFSADEVRRILQHGPWPMRWSRDPSNRASGKPAAIAFGERLFFDARLSAKASMACASCHEPERNWADGRKLGVGLEEVDRNTPSVMNVRYNRWFGWDGSNDNLWAQSMRPLLDPRELAVDDRHVAELLRNDRELACRYRQAFGAPPSPSDNEAVLVDVGKALAAFEETLVSGRTPFDDFRDALHRGDRKAAARYPESAQRGLRIFIGKGSCNLCHLGPNFTNGEFHEIGIPVLRKLGSVDWGRYQGIKMLHASRFNLEGAYNDDASRSTAISTQHVALGPQNYEQFKIPSLRNVALTAPYMHNGHLATLRDVVKHYSEVDLNMLHQVHLYDSDGVPQTLPVDKILKPLHLSEQEIDDVVAFLETLTDRQPAAPRKPSDATRACRSVP